MSENLPIQDMVAEIASISGNIQKEVRRLHLLSQMIQTKIRREWGSRQREAQDSEDLESINLDVRRHLIFAQTWLRFAGATDNSLQRSFPSRKLIEATIQDEKEREDRKIRQVEAQARKVRRLEANQNTRLWPAAEDMESLYGKDLVDNGRE